MASPEVDSAQLVGGRYVLERCIGRGGMGEVWRARHVTLNTHVAIKLLLGALASEDVTRKRFLKEAQLTAQLKTRHAVQVFDFGVTDEGRPYLVMELLDGETLDQRLSQVGRLSFPDAVKFLRVAGRALDRAHQLGIIHRDFKPENIFVVADEEGTETVKVVDFGIAKLVGELETESSGIAASLPMGREALSTFTHTATLVGTPYYMSPEQLGPTPSLSAQTDIWALGVVAFECLTGQRPFDADELAVLFMRIEHRMNPRASDLVPDLPRAFDDWFERACAIDPAARFTTAYEATVALAQALGVDDGESRPRLAFDSHHSWRPSGYPVATPPAQPVPLVLSSGVFGPREVGAGSRAPAESEGADADTSRRSSVLRLAGAAAAGALIVLLVIGLIARGRAKTAAPSSAHGIVPGSSGVASAAPLEPTTVTVERLPAVEPGDDVPTIDPERDLPRVPKPVGSEDHPRKRGSGKARGTGVSGPSSAPPGNGSSPSSDQPSSIFKLPELGL